MTVDTAEGCKLNVAKRVTGQSLSEVNVFSASGDFLQIGQGTVDEETIMINGNVKNFPMK